ncbi:MAG: hypothetical protein IMF10_07375 [Proteobacteria bacterium]|nr:hypothetical protein [Pseudomonadota bacterium]
MNKRDFTLRIMELRMSADNEVDDAEIIELRPIGRIWQMEGENRERVIVYENHARENLDVEYYDLKGILKQKRTSKGNYLDNIL